MHYETVIVRDFRGNPLRRVVLGHGNGLVYVANPGHLDAVLAGDSSPVGFTEKDVYVFEDALFNGDFGAMDKDG